uniref:hypothetical protein n=2 Tax=Pseudoruminococcus massiliensis TaxID=2086583 RepID=UPI003AB52CAA
IKGWLIMEKAINFKIDSELYKKIKIKTVMEDITIKQYILGLIEKDIENSEATISDFVEK